MTDQKVKTVFLNDLRGLHMLSGVDYEPHIAASDYKTDNMRNAINFILDEVTYTAFEDDGDGYRSMLDEILVTDKKITNTFQPVQVYAMWNGDEDMDTVVFYDTHTNGIVLEVGTDRSDSGYPIFVYTFQSENMVINQEIK